MEHFHFYPVQNLLTYIVTFKSVMFGKSQCHYEYFLWTCKECARCWEAYATQIVVSCR